MTRISAWLAGTLGTLFLLFGYHTSTSATMQAMTAPAITGSTTGTGNGSSGGTSGSGSAGGISGGSGSGAGSGTTTSGGTGGSGGTGASGTGGAQTFTGAATATRYGPVQVELTVQDGSITTVSVLQYPHSDGRDQQINSYALPQLIDATIAAQSAQIDMVSGASYTSEGYLGSLQSALDQAGL